MTNSDDIGHNDKERNASDADSAVSEPQRGYGGSGTEDVKLEDYFTYADYCSWDDDTRWELIDGVAYAMGAPTIVHQRIILKIARQLGAYLDGKTCEVFIAPLDVRLNADGADDTVVQPDLLVVCDEEKLKDGKSVVGAPDLAVEVLSPSSLRHDKIRKFNAYLKAGIKEYWIIDPDEKTLAVNILQDGAYITRLYPGGGAVPVHVLEGCEIDLSEVFVG